MKYETLYTIHKKYNCCNKHNFFTGITILGGLLNLGNTLGYWLISIGSAIIIGYFYLRCNYQRNMNRLDPGVLDSLK